MADKDYIYGRHPVLEALQTAAPVEKVVLQQGTRGAFERELRHLCRDRGVPMQVAPRERLDRMVRGNHQGVIAYLAAVAYQRVADVLPMIYEKGELPLLLLLDGVTDVRNLGAIARSAEVTGAQALVVPRSGSASLNADAVKSSAGALLRLPVCREQSLVSTVDFLRESGLRVYASDLSGQQELHQLDLREPTALILGSEGKGIQPALARTADERFRIPQRGHLNSFNVSVAAGIMLYEAMRQRS